MSYIMSHSSFWNLIDLTSTILVIIFVIMDLTEADYFDGRNLASVTVFFLWVKMFYFLRIFHPTAAFIRMITEVIKDMWIFTFMLIVALMAFTNAFFILDGQFMMKGQVRANGNNLGEAFSYTYVMGLAEWEVDAYQQSPHT
jgi:hypothetical protein